MDCIEILIKEIKELDGITDAGFILQLLIIVRNHKMLNSTKE